MIRFVQVFCYGFIGFILSINGIHYNNVSYWAIVLSVLVIHLSTAFLD